MRQDLHLLFYLQWEIYGAGPEKMVSDTENEPKICKNMKMSIFTVYSWYLSKYIHKVINRILFLHLYWIRLQMSYHKFKKWSELLNGYHANKIWEGIHCCDFIDNPTINSSIVRYDSNCSHKPRGTSKPNFSSPKGYFPSITSISKI